MTTIISVKNLKKTFRTHKREEGVWAAFKSVVKRKHVYKKAMKGLNFEIQKGELVGLIGPNGAGKSTCIKALCGVLYPDEGEANVLGYCPWKDRKDYVANIGVVFGQKSQLWWDLPPIDTFHMLRTVYSTPKTTFMRRLKYMTKLLDVEEVIKSPVRKLSLGERMKCEVIASFLHNPKILFLDEPTIGMDVISKNKLRSFVKKINKRYGTTVILTTHNMDDVEKLCNRVIIINFGEIVYDGSLKTIMEKYIHSKTLRIKFGSRAGALRLPKGCKIIKKTPFIAVIEVDIKKQKVRNIIAHLLKKFDVDDIAIDEPPICNVIEDIYKYEGKK